MGKTIAFLPIIIFMSLLVVWFGDAPQCKQR